MSQKQKKTGSQKINLMCIVSWRSPKSPSRLTISTIWVTAETRWMRILVAFRDVPVDDLLKRQYKCFIWAFFFIFLALTTLTTSNALVSISKFFANMHNVTFLTTMRCQLGVPSLLHDHMIADSFLIHRWRAQDRSRDPMQPALRSGMDLIIFIFCRKFVFQNLTSSRLQFWKYVWYIVFKALNCMLKSPLFVWYLGGHHSFWLWWVLTELRSNNAVLVQFCFASKNQVLKTKSSLSLSARKACIERTLICSM